MKRTGIKRSKIPMKRSELRRTPMRTRPGDGFKRPVQAKKKKGKKRTGPNRQTLTKRAKKRVWDLCRLIVIKRDGGICVICRTPDPKGGVHVHHCIVFAGSCLRTRYLTDNLVSLCYSCHKFKIHLQGDAWAYDRMWAYMFTLITKDRYEEIKAMKFEKALQRNLEDYLELEEKLKARVQA